MSTIPKRKGERVYDSSTDSSHPAPGGNFVLLDRGKAWYHGAAYYREGYAPQSAVKPAPVVEPEPTHRHPEGLYQSGRTRIIVRHEPEDETYSFLYIDNALAGNRDPVNRGMSGGSLSRLGYTLVTEFKA